MPASQIPRIPDCFTRPLGRGVRDLLELIELFHRPAPDAPGANPNVQRSLECFARLPELELLLRRLPASPSVLIQGYTDPGNAGALRRFLRPRLKGEPTVSAIDLYDLPAVYRLLEFPVPDFEFQVADASDLRAHFADGSVDVAVQDFLLNCAPAALHVPIFSELARILSARGLALISFSDRAGVCPRPTMDTFEFARRFGQTWRTDAYNIADIFPAELLAENELMGLGRTVVYVPESKTATLITEPSGRFEFFRDAEVMLNLIREAGLETFTMDRSEGIDSHGLCCVRYRCILGRSG